MIRALKNNTLLPIYQFNAIIALFYQYWSWLPKTNG